MLGNILSLIQGVVWLVLARALRRCLVAGVCRVFMSIDRCERQVTTGAFAITGAAERKQEEAAGHARWIINGWCVQASLKQVRGGSQQTLACNGRGGLHVLGYRSCGVTQQWWEAVDWVRRSGGASR